MAKSRACRKCGKIIPNWIKIDGKSKNLQNRKFCLLCSPYKGRNTSPNDPIIRKSRKYKDYTQEKKDRVKTNLYYRALRRKEELIKKSGGGCQQCGYKKSRRSLCFHHRDSETKRFGMTLNNLWSKSWAEILGEWNKCDLLCANCHGEVEDVIGRKTHGIVEKVNIRYGTTF